MSHSQQERQQTSNNQLDPDEQYWPNVRQHPCWDPRVGLSGELICQICREPMNMDEYYINWLDNNALPREQQIDLGERPVLLRSGHVFGNMCMDDWTAANCNQDQALSCPTCCLDLIHPGSPYPRRIPLYY